MSYGIPIKIVMARAKTVKKKFITKKSGLFTPKKYTRMSEPTTNNNPLAAQTLKTHGHNLARNRRMLAGR